VIRVPDRPTLEHIRLSSLEIDGRPLEITSAELVWTQHWRGDAPAQLEWEVVGRTRDDLVLDGVTSLAITHGDRRFRGRGVATSSRAHGLTVFNIVGLGDLAEVRRPAG
jgi:hypothetical protein